MDRGDGGVSIPDISSSPEDSRVPLPEIVDSLASVKLMSEVRRKIRKHQRYNKTEHSHTLPQ